MLRAVVALLTVVYLCWPAQAQKRIALVVGNSAYQHTPTLLNPRNDASDMAEALAKHGFHVIKGFDLPKAAFDQKVRDFSAALKGYDAAVFFYAGHALEVAGQNYLLPIDAKAETEDALDWEMLRVDVVQRAMERSSTTNIIFLDACRDNPLARNLARSMGTRSGFVGRGLASIEGGIGSLISFSTQPGNVALDGEGRNSPFTRALVRQISTSTEDLSGILIAVRNQVMMETKRKQVPWEHSALTGRFYFSPPGAPIGTPKSPSQPIVDAAPTHIDRAKSLDPPSVVASLTHEAPKPGVIPVMTPFKRLGGHKQAIVGIGFSADARLVMSYSGRDVRLWSTDTGVELGRITADDGSSIAGAALLELGEKLVVSYGTNQMELFETATRRSLKKAVTYCNSRSIHPLTTGSRGLVPGCGGFWDLSKLSIERKVKLVNTPYFAVNQALDVAIWMTDEEITVWDLSRDAPRFVLPGHDQGKNIATVAVSRDGAFGLSGSRVNEFKLWDLRDGREKGVYRIGEGAVNALAMAPNNKFILVSNFREGFYQLSKWDIATAREVAILNTGSNSSYVTSIVFSESGALALTGDDTGRLNVWKF